MLLKKLPYNLLTEKIKQVIFLTLVAALSCSMSGMSS